jgi:hypothetical protein
MATGTTAPGRAQIQARTLRTDRWWVPPLLTFLGLTSFLVYGVWRALYGKYYFDDDSQLLAPFYSPCLSTKCVEGASDFGQPIGSWWPFSPALFILVFPGGFRFTCYYYRKAYYRSFWLSPPACAVAEPHGRYTGETRFPLLIQNIHRYFFYAAIVVAAILTWDVVRSFKDGSGHWGHMGLGSLVLLANVVLIWLYTLSCHSCRHITGGRLKNFSKHPLRYRFWTFVSKLNARHMLLAWVSLFSVMAADFYVLLVAANVFDDPRFF